MKYTNLLYCDLKYYGIEEIVLKTRKALHFTPIHFKYL